MAAGLGFKDFVTGEVLTANDVDGYLMQGIWVFANAAARTAAVTSPQEGNYSFLKDTNSTEYYDGAAWVAVGGGGGGGKVLQVVSTTYSTQTTISSTTFTDTGLSLAITPTLSTSKVLVMFSQQSAAYRASISQGARLKLLRGGTDIWTTGTGTAFNIFANGTSEVAMGSIQSVTYLDSPATTSSTTYKVQARPEADSSSGSFTAQANSAVSTITLLEIGA